jgi:hypothetical protein
VKLLLGYGIKSLKKSIGVNSSVFALNWKLVYFLLCYIDALWRDRNLFALETSLSWERSFGLKFFIK